MIRTVVERASRRRIGLVVILTLLTALLLATPSGAQDSNRVYVLTFDGPVNPILSSYIERAITQAEAESAEAIVLRLDTPGGQVDLTQDIVKAMRSSSVPIIIYVWPTGAMAGSAGTFITLAGHAAGMVSGSTIGAASPVAEGGAELGDTIQQKITNILAADIENLARRRGDKAVEWARSAVTNARAATAQEALSLGVVDAVAEDVPDLLQQLDGFEVEVNGELRPLALAGANVIELPMTSPENTLNTLINAIAVPGIAVLLIVLGVQGIISEFSQPGGYMAGTAGFVALLLGMYALGILNANWVGLGFMLLSFILFFLEIKAPTHGALTVAGVVTFVFGAYVLFSGTEAGVPWAAILGLAGATLLFFTFIVAKAIGAQRLKPAWGAESLIGQLAFVRTELNPSGTVVVQGERWQAELQDGSATVQPGARVVVVERHGFKLLVRPDSSSPASP